MGKAKKKEPVMEHKMCTECRKEIFGLPAVETKTKRGTSMCLCMVCAKIMGWK